MQYVYPIALFVALLLSQTLRADDHGTDYDGIDLTVLGGMQYELCQLRSGKTLEDADKQVKSAAKEFARLKLGLGIINFTPVFDHADANNKTADYITMVYGSIPAFAEGWDRWEQSSQAAKVMKTRSEVGDCHFKFNHVLYKHMNVPALEKTDRRVVQTEWCTPKPGVTSDQLKAKHDSWLTASKDKLNSIGWAIIIPKLGQANSAGSFMHFFIFDSLGALMRDQEWQANGGGAAGIQDYYNSYADCSGPSVWSGSLAQRPSQ